MRFDKLVVSDFLNKRVVSEIFNFVLMRFDKLAVSNFLNNRAVSEIFSLKLIRLDKPVVSMLAPPLKSL